MTKKLNLNISILCLLVFMFQINDSNAENVESATEPASYEEAVEMVDEFSAIVEGLRSQLDRSQFDLEALAEKLEYDAKKVTQFVKQEIYFEQYPGLLRGAQGTLLARAGNSLDQSVLLATLLKNIGYEARIVNGKLNLEDTERLLSQLSINRKPQTSVGDEEKLKINFHKLADFLGVDAEETQSEFKRIFENLGNPSAEDIALTDIYRNVTTDRKFLENSLEKNKIKLGGPEYFSDLLEETADYYWVRFRSGPSEEWENVHVAFYPGIENPNIIKELEQYTESIPNEKQHRIRIQAFVERKLGSKVEIVPVMAPWERPAANMIGHTITYRNQSDGFKGLTEWDPTAIAAAIKSSETFYPIVNGSLAEKPKAFDLLGNVASPDDMSSPQAGIFRTVGANAGKATSMLSSMNKSKAEAASAGPIQALLQQWVEITVIDPSGEAHKNIRVLAHKAGNGSDSDYDFKSSLVQEMSIFVSAGAYPRAYLIDQTLLQLHNLRTLIYSGVFHESKIKQQAMSGPEYLTESGLRWSEFLTLVQLFDTSKVLTPELLSYRSRPLVVAKYRPVDYSAVGKYTVDIVENERRAFRNENGNVRADFHANLLYGVWDTHAESLAIIADSDNGMSTLSIFKTASEQNIGSILVTKNNKSLIEGIGLSDLTKANLNRDLENNLLVMPASNISNLADFGWWRIDPKTGQTLGMTNFGGAITVEALTEHVVNTLGTAFATAGFRASLICVTVAGTIWVGWTVGVGQIDPSLGLGGPAIGWATKKLLKKFGITLLEGMTVEAFLEACVVSVALKVPL